MEEGVVAGMVRKGEPVTMVHGIGVSCRRDDQELMFFFGRQKPRTDRDVQRIGVHRPPTRIIVADTWEELPLQHP